MNFVPAGQGFLGDGGRPVSAQNAFGKYFDITGRVASYIFQGDSLISKLPNSPTVPLVASGGALVNQAFPVDAEGEPNESPLVTAAYQYTNAAGVFHEIADADALDFDGSESWAISALFRTITDAFPAAAGAITGKRDPSAPNYGWEWLLGTDGSVTLQWKDTDDLSDALGFSTYNSAAGQHRYADGRLHTLDVEFDIAAGEVRAGNEHESSMAAAWSAASMSSPTTFRLGAVRGFAAAIQIAYLVVSVGPQAMKNDPSNTAYLLAQETSLTTVQRHNEEPIT